jgi:hypothetical protein
MISKTDINRPGNVFFAGYGHHHSTENDENGRSGGIRTHDPFTPCEGLKKFVCNYNY